MNKSTLLEKREEVGRRGRPPVTALARQTFLTMLASTHQVRRACEAAGIDHSTAYLLRKRDPEFAEQWELAMESLPGRVMDAMLKLARLDDDTPEQGPTFKLFDKFHGRPGGNVNVAVGVVNNAPDASKDFAAVQEEWLRRRRALERVAIEADAIEAEVINDDIEDLL